MSGFALLRLISPFQPLHVNLQFSNFVSVVSLKNHHIVSGLLFDLSVAQLGVEDDVQELLELEVFSRHVARVDVPWACPFN